LESICIFGDSIAKGVALDSDKGKYVLLKDSFANMIAASGVKVANFSRFGCTVTAGLGILARSKPDLGAYGRTLLEFGGNDCDYNWIEVSEDPFAGHVCNTPIDMFPVHYKTMIDAVTAAGGRPVLLTLPPIDDDRYFAHISQGLNADNIMSFLGTARTIFTWHEKFSALVSSLAETLSLPLADLRAGFLAAGGYRDMLCDDGIHLNRAGHALAFRILSESLPL
jgi:lysophospholipase L1-like esterase